MIPAQNRPVYLNLLRIRQPVTAILSILHRITGVLMVLLLPGLIYLLGLSLESAEGFSRVAGLVNSSLAKLLAVLLSWVLAHHLLAGIRFLLLDIDLGVSRTRARHTAWLTHGLALVSALLVGGYLL